MHIADYLQAALDQIELTQSRKKHSNEIHITSKFLYFAEITSRGKSILNTTFKTQQF